MKNKPAFPSGNRILKRPPHDPGGNFYEMQRTEPLNSGMTLRDYFAAKALEGLIACSEEDNPPENAAFWAYQFADAMLKAREEGREAV